MEGQPSQQPRRAAASWSAALAALVVIGAIVAFESPYLTIITTQFLIFAVIATGLDLVVGKIRLPHLGVSAFVGVGAYTAALVTQKAGLPWWAGCVLGLVSAAIAATIGGLVVLRTRGVYFLMASFALGQIGYNAIFAARGLTGADNGLSGFSRPSLFGVSLASGKAFAWGCFIVFAIVWAALHLCSSLPIGDALRGVGENEMRMEAWGYNVSALKLLAFVASGMIAGLGGIMLLFYNQSIGPDNVSVVFSGQLFLMVLLGGRDTSWGPSLGAAVVAIVTVLFSSRAGAGTFILGALLVLSVMAGGEGIVGGTKRARLASERLLRWARRI